MDVRDDRAGRTRIQSQLGRCDLDIGDLLSDKLERVLVSSRLQHPDFILVVCQDILVIEGEAEFLSGYGAVVYEIPEDLLCEGRIVLQVIQHIIHDGPVNAVRVGISGLDL